MLLRGDGDEDSETKLYDLLKYDGLSPSLHSRRSHNLVLAAKSCQLHPPQRNDSGLFVLRNLLRVFHAGHLEPKH